jgi:hypothetical protein
MHSSLLPTRRECGPSGTLKMFPPGSSCATPDRLPEIPNDISTHHPQKQAMVSLCSPAYNVAHLSSPAHTRKSQHSGAWDEYRGNRSLHLYPTVTAARMLCLLPHPFFHVSNLILEATELFASSLIDLSLPIPTRPCHFDIYLLPPDLSPFAYVLNFLSFQHTSVLPLSENSTPPQDNPLSHKIPTDSRFRHPPTSTVP